jgi:hypothetical protein
MLQMPSTITKPLALTVTTGNGEADLTGELRYDPADPFAISLAIGTECGEPVIWTFARDLLSAGVSAPSCEGDITIEPDLSEGAEERVLRVTLATDCLATMLISTDRVDLDSEIAALLG